MRLSTLFVAAFASLVVAENQFLDRRADKACAPGNNCQRGVGGVNGKPALNNRLADCKALNTVTVIPATVTETSYSSTLVVRIPTGWPVKRKPDGTPADPPAPPAAAEAQPTTIFPTATPTYATYCKAPTAYFSACACAGVTAATTTLEAPTTTVTSTEDACYGRKIVRRAGEAMGYEYPPRWEEYHIPGYRLF